MTRASIPRLTGDAPRPTWSVMIPTYHCAAYLRHTLESVLRQDPGPAEMQIEVVDDCSTRDDPEAVVAAVGRGRVSFFRQPRNVGHVHTFDTCVQRARGRLVHLLHGDDAVLEGFYRTMRRPFDADARVGAAFCRYIAMDERGHWHTLGPIVRAERGILEHWLERLATGQLLQAPSMVVRRAVYEHLGGFDQRIATYGEDWEMWVRIAAHYPVWFEPEPLAAYRVHGASLSGDPARFTANMRDLRTAIDINHALLPSARAEAITREARGNVARAIIRRAHRRARAGTLHAPMVHVREALRFEPSLVVAARAALLLAHWGARRSLGRTSHVR